MTFAITAFQADGVEVEEAVTRYFRQRAMFTITAANTDVALDVGTYAGTFWTAAGGSAVGAKALKAIKDIQIRAKAFNKAGGSGLAGKAQADASYTATTYLTSAALAGGAATETATVTGLLKTDTIVAVTQSVPNGTATVALCGWSDQADNALKVYYTANPGAGGKVIVGYQRTATSVLAGTYTLALNATNTNIPDITFSSGDAPTAYTLILEWELKSDETPVAIVA